MWRCMLHQSHFGSKNNKFYVIQILEKDGGSYVLWRRWGNIGAPGQNHALRCASLVQAKGEFETKFHAKTGVAWKSRSEIKPKNGKYMPVDLFYDDSAPAEDPDARIRFTMDLTAEAIRRVLAGLDEENSDTLKEDVVVSRMPVAVVTKNSRILSPSVDELFRAVVPSTLSVQFDRPNENMPIASTLHPHLQDTMRLLCDLNMMKTTLIDSGVDSRMRLADINSAMVFAGYVKLGEIESELDGQNRPAELERLTEEFMAVIPHNSFRQLSELVINSVEKLKGRARLLDSLVDIEVGYKLLTAENDAKKKNPLDFYYENFMCGLKPLHPTCTEFKMVETYAHNTHGSTHGEYKLSLKHLFAVDKLDGSKFTKHKNAPNRQLLWYGSQLANWVGVLSKGLRTPPKEAPLSAYMFGKGVYFSDCVSEAANMCKLRKDRGVLLLCEVVLGEMNEKLHPDCYADKLPVGKLSTKGLGRIAPMSSETTKSGLNIPLGQMGVTRLKSASLWYNEFVVYNTDFIRPKYLCDFEFIYNDLFNES